MRACCLPGLLVIWERVQHRLAALGGTFVVTVCWVTEVAGSPGTPQLAARQLDPSDLIVLETADLQNQNDHHLEGSYFGVL